MYGNAHHLFGFTQAKYDSTSIVPSLLLYLGQMQRLVCRPSSLSLLLFIVLSNNKEEDAATDPALVNPVSESGTILFCGLQAMRKLRREKSAAEEKAQLLVLVGHERPSRR